MHRQALYVAGVIFAVVALAHGVRFWLATEVTVGGSAIPVSVSLPAAVVTALLAVWMIVAARRS